MLQTSVKLDRYLSFAGLDCDERASQLLSRVRQHLAGKESHWRDFFETRLSEAKRRGEDDLYLVGSQVNVLRDFFADFQDEDGIELLEALEEECC